MPADPAAGLTNRSGRAQAPPRRRPPQPASWRASRSACNRSLAASSACAAALPRAQLLRQLIATRVAERSSSSRSACSPPRGSPRRSAHSHGCVIDAFALHLRPIHRDHPDLRPAPPRAQPKHLDEQPGQRVLDDGGETPRSSSDQAPRFAVITLNATSSRHARSIRRDDRTPRAYAYNNNATRWIQLVVATPDVEELRCRGETGRGSCCCSRDALGWTSACGAKGASGPVLGGDRSRCVERERCGRGGCVAEHWCPVVSQGWRDAASHPRAGVRALSVVHRARGDRGPARRRLSGCREIARRLGRAPSTISRELQRNAAIGRGRR